MIGNTGKDIDEPGLRINIIELGRLDQRVNDGGAFATAIGTAEQPGFAAKRHAAQGAFRGVVA